jgi:hypothetical protein
LIFLIKNIFAPRENPKFHNPISTTLPGYFTINTILRLQLTTHFIRKGDTVELHGIIIRGQGETSEVTYKPYRH